MEPCTRVDGRTAKIMLWGGAGLVTAGTAAIYWPASLVVAGVLLMRIAAAADLKRHANVRQRAAEQAKAKPPPRAELRT